MSSKLTDEQLLILSNLVYIEWIYDTEFSSVREFAKYVEKNIPKLLASEDIKKEAYAGYDNEEQLLELMKTLQGAEFENLKFGKNIDNLDVTAMEFYFEGEEESYVIFQGTPPDYDKWDDNTEGLYLSDTPSQIAAAEFIETIESEHITVSGHSKGGNLAAYVTVLFGSKIDYCVSFDGQGFGEAFREKYKDILGYASPKIKQVNAFNDYVNGTLPTIAEYVFNYQNTGKYFHAHCPYSLWQTNAESLKQYNGMFVEDFSCSKSQVILYYEAALAEMIRILPAEDEEFVADIVGPLLGYILATNDSERWRRAVHDLLENQLEYLSQSDNPVEFLIRHATTVPITVLLTTVIARVHGFKLLADFVLEIIEKAKKVWAKFMEKINAMVQKIKETAKSVWDAIVGWATDVIESCESFISSAWDWMTDRADDIVDVTTQIVEYVEVKVDKIKNINPVSIVSRMRDYSDGCLDFFVGRITEIQSDHFEPIDGLLYRFSGEPWMRRLVIDGCVGRIGDLYEQAEDGIEIVKQNLEENFEKVKRIDNVLMDTFRYNVGQLKEIQEIIFE